MKGTDGMKGRRNEEDKEEEWDERNKGSKGDQGGKWDKVTKRTNGKKGTTQGKGRKGPVSGSYDLIGLRAFIKPLPDQQRPAVTPPITNNYATNTVTLPPTPSTIVRKENTIIPTFFCREILTTMSGTAPWAKFTFQKGFLWVGPLVGGTVGDPQMP